MSLDILFKSIGANLATPAAVVQGLAATDTSEAQLLTATSFLETVYGSGDSRMASRAQTPLLVGPTAPYKMWPLYVW